MIDWLIDDGISDGDVRKPTLWLQICQIELF